MHERPPVTLRVKGMTFHDDCSGVGGGDAGTPRTPCGGRVIAFKWPGRPPRKNPGDAAGLESKIRHISCVTPNIIRLRLY